VRAIEFCRAVEHRIGERHPAPMRCGWRRPIADGGGIATLKKNAGDRRPDIADPAHQDEWCKAHPNTGAI
jgi:hypothetical protein